MRKDNYSLRQFRHLHFTLQFITNIWKILGKENVVTDNLLWVGEIEQPIDMTKRARSTISQECKYQPLVFFSRKLIYVFTTNIFA